MSLSVVGVKDLRKVLPFEFSGVVKRKITVGDSVDFPGVRYTGVIAEVGVASSSSFFNAFLLTGVLDLRNGNLAGFHEWIASACSFFWN